MEKREVLNLKMRVGTKLIVYLANNRGRGTNNCTVFCVGEETTRTGSVKTQKSLPFFAVIQTSAWGRNINVSKKKFTSMGWMDEE